MAAATRSPFVFCSSEGRELVKNTIRTRLPYVPHDYQLNGVCKLLDGIDLVAVLPTGAGKTGYYTMYMLMLLELSKNPALCDPPTRLSHKISASLWSIQPMA
ncbi:hypothetical protein TRAPUB_9636 [Trametes pubescens]|uniref:DEAD/DEAH box helicase domain-containing protein n=1 Tax=Trametes pubescens TaxID=154538 RepID=A0A1M2W1P9_TRAPU|nr:hypothetical protein TRAPUB_9636 [Trametes pubescens]